VFIVLADTVTIATLKCVSHKMLCSAVLSLETVAMVTADGSRPVSDFLATISKKLNNDPLLKSTDNWYFFVKLSYHNICGVWFLWRSSVVIISSFG